MTKSRPGLCIVYTVYIYIYIYMCVSLSVCVYIFVYIYIYIYICVCVCVYVCLCVCVYICIYIYIYIYMCVYLSKLLSHYIPPRPLRSQNSGRLIIPRISKSTAGGRSFSYLAPKLWNNLPNTVREADTLCQFKSRLKTHLFNLAYT